MRPADDGGRRRAACRSRMVTGWRTRRRSMDSPLLLRGPLPPLLLLCSSTSADVLFLFSVSEEHAYCYCIMCAECGGHSPRSLPLDTLSALLIFVRLPRARFLLMLPSQSARIRNSRWSNVVCIMPAMAICPGGASGLPCCDDHHDDLHCTGRVS